MSWLATPLGLLACASMSASAWCHLLPAAGQESHRHDRHDWPEEAPDQPPGCHAVLGCAAHRKPRTFP